MKAGKTLTQMAQELTRIKEAKKDFIVPVERMKAEVVQNVLDEDVLTIGFENGSKHNYELNNWSGSQLAQYTDIPKAYFDRVSQENPKLMADNINHGLERIAVTAQRVESRMVRTLDGRIRAFLGSSYRLLDAHDLLEVILPIMIEKGLEIVNCEITERRLYIKAICKNLQTEIKTGDVVEWGVIVSTSDVGAGSLRIEPFCHRLICLNGMIFRVAMRKYHRGRNQADEEIQEILSDRTKELSDAAFWSSAKDMLLASLRPENFEREVNRLREAASLPIKNFDLPEVVELSMKAVGISGENKKNSILAALASGNEGAGLTQWGLINSFTRAAQAEELTYEESIEMERAAGMILELPKKDWSTISATA